MDNHASAQHDGSAHAALLASAYDELRRLAQAYISGQAPGHDLDPTALVHEAALRLLKTDSSRFENEAHFYAVAALAMRQILIDYARRSASRNRAVSHKTTLEPHGISLADFAPEQLLAIDESLERLRAADERAFELVMLRFYAGVSDAQAANLLGVSPSTVSRTWRFARAWLENDMNGGPRA